VVIRKLLTHTRQAEVAKPEPKPYKLKVGSGLFLEITPTGSKRWRFRYYYLGKEQMISMGLFPDVGLHDAKEARDLARRMLAQGLNPSQKRAEAKRDAMKSQQDSFQNIAEEWLDRQNDKADSTQTKSRWLLNFAIKDFGKHPITDISPKMVLDTCRKLESRGKLETASRIKVKCSQVFRYAVATSRLDRDPTTDLRGALKTVHTQHRAAMIDPASVGKLLRDIDNYGGRQALCCALKLAPLVFVRPGELRAAQWADIDLDKAEWRYTPPKTRKQTRVDLIVPLSHQAVAILREMHASSGKKPYVFHSSSAVGYLSEGAVLQALRKMGYEKEEMSGHGFRAMAKTLLLEELKVPDHYIELQLGHMVRDPNGGAYNRTRFLPERKEMMQQWADYLDELKKL
jgi:integrase